MRRFTGLTTRTGRRIMEGDFVLMRWGGGRHRLHKVTFHQDGNVITWLLGAPDSKHHTWNLWTGKDVEVVPAAKARALWEAGQEVGPQLQPLPPHPFDQLMRDISAKAVRDTLAELEQARGKGL